MSEIIIDNEISSPQVFSRHSDSNIDHVLLFSSRSYIHYDLMSNNILGSFIAMTPKIAAEKAFTSLLKKIKMENGDAAAIQKIYLIDENTDISYTFLAQRIKRTKPFKIDIGSEKNFVFHYKNLIEKIE